MKNSLASLRPGQEAIVDYLTGSEDMQHRLAEMGFVHGGRVRMLYTAPVGTPIIYELLGTHVALRRIEAEEVKINHTKAHTTPTAPLNPPEGGRKTPPTPPLGGEKDTTKPQTATPAPSDSPLRGREKVTIPLQSPLDTGNEDTSPAFPESGHHCQGDCACCSSCPSRKKSLPPKGGAGGGCSLPPKGGVGGGCSLPPKGGAGGGFLPPSGGLRGAALRFALVGNPNCGKTSLFNAACGGHERVGNYSGVTVHSVEGETTVDGRRLQVVDLPGTYSLHAFSPEEAYVWRELKNGSVDAVINVIDVNNLERNLLLTLQVRRLGIPMVAALNIYDEFQAGGSRLDVQQLSQRLGIPLIPTVARTRQGIEALLRAAIDVADNQPSAPAVPEHYHTADNPADDPCESDADEARYTGGLDFGFIHRMVADIYNKEESPAARLTRRIDRWVATRWVAYPLFVVLMALIFWATFAIGSYPMDWIDRAVAFLAGFIGDNLPQGWLSDMLTDGILGGVGSVIIFLPNILILYFLMSALEDSGYLARAALLTDPALRRIGLHGKSFIPLLMGFGCNVPAIMATRTIESAKSRMITMMVLPLMSCSARIPVYTAFAGAFFFRHASWVMMGLYALGIATALMVAAVLNRVLMRSHESHFVMELPTYRLPQWHSVCSHTWQKGKQYLHKMGGVILVASIVIWALGYFPRSGEMPAGNEQQAHLCQSEATMSPAAWQQEHSYMGKIGHFIEPLIRPLGFDWRMGVGIVAGVGAKELMVSTLGVLYGCSEEESTEEPSIGDGSPTRLQQLISRHTTRASALSYMVFALLYFPCLATVAAVRGETGRLRWAVFIALYTTALAYLAAFLTYRLALGLPPCLLH